MNSSEELEKILDFQCLDPYFYFDYSLKPFDLIVILNNHKLYSTKEFNAFIARQTKQGAALFDLGIDEKRKKVHLIKLQG